MLVIEIPWDPVALKLGGLLLTWHGVFTAVGALVGIQVAFRLARLTGFGEDQAYTAFLVGLASGIVGARALYVIEHWERFSQDPARILRITEGGISIWGALVVGFAASIIFARWRGYHVRLGLDVAAFGSLVGLAVGRLGDLVNGEHLSRASDLPWAVVYTDPDSPGFVHSLIVGSHHPATTYEMLILLAVFGLMFPLYHRYLALFPGLTFVVAAAAYAVTRFLLTWTRVDSAEVALGLRVPQVVSLLVLVVAGFLAWYWLRLGRVERSSIGSGDAT